MVSTRTLNRSFNGGEVTPEFYGQVEDTKYQTGVSTARNAIVTPHGPLTNRRGSEYIAPTKTANKQARNIPFVFSEEQAFAIEFGDGYIRFLTQGAQLLTGTVTAWSNATAYEVGDLALEGGVNYYCILAHTNQIPPNATYWYAMPAGNILEIPSPYAEADLFQLVHVQDSDVLTITHENYDPRELRRLGAADWVLSTTTFGSDLTAPTSPSVTRSVTGSSRTLQRYAVTAVQEDGSIESLPSSRAAINITINAATNASPGVFTSSAAHGLVVGQVVDFAAGAVTGMTQLNGNTYVVNTTPTSTTFTLQAVADGTALDTSAFGVFSGTATMRHYPFATANNLTSAPNTNTFTWAAVSGATVYNVYKESNGIYGFVGQTDGTTFQDDNIAADLGNTVPIARTPFTGAGNRPRAVSYAEQRKVFAGTINQPQNAWLTRTNTENDLSYSLPSKSTDGISFRIRARENNTILHIVPLGDLLFLTASAVWRLASSTGGPLAQDNLDLRVQSYIGAARVQPTVVNNTLLYVAVRSNHIRELGYSDTANGFVSGDLSLRAPHLFDGLTTRDMAYSQSPYPIIWSTSSNGRLLGITYVPEQQVGAWHRHDTYTKAGQSYIESVCSIPENGGDSLYLVVHRRINGVDVRYQERLRDRRFSDIKDAFFVDCGVTFNNPVTITGITAADPVVVTAPSHGFNDGDEVDISDVLGMTEVNDIRYRVANKTANTFELQTFETPFTDIDGTGFTAYESGGVVRKAVTTISGLTHLEGETVNILADGGVHQQLTVASGSVTLDAPSSVVQIGLPITMDVATLPIVIRAAGYGQGRPKNVKQAYIRVNETSSLFAGVTFDTLKMYEGKVRTDEPYGVPPRLTNGEILIPLPPSWNDSGVVCLRNIDPVPVTIVSMALEVSVGG